MRQYFRLLFLMAAAALLPECGGESCNGQPFPRGTFRLIPHDIQTVFHDATMVVGEDEVVFTLEMADGTTQVGTYRITDEWHGG